MYVYNQLPNGASLLCNGRGISFSSEKKSPSYFLYIWVTSLNAIKIKISSAVANDFNQLM